MKYRISDAPPPVSLQRVTFAPVLLEPLLGSGERLTIMVSTETALGEVHVWPVVNTTSLRSLLRPGHEAAVAAARLVHRDLESHVKAGRKLAEWQPPIEGVFVGETHEQYVASVDEIYERILEDYSAFATRDIRASGSSPRDYTEETVIEMIRFINPALSAFVGRPAHLGSTAFETRFTFLSPTLAAQFVKVSPKSVRRAVTHAKACLWDLHLIPSAPGQLFRPNRRELYAGLGSGSPADRATAEAIYEVEREADIREVPVVRVDSARDAAERIVASAA